MIYSILYILIGLISIYFVFKLKNRDNNLWDKSTSFSGFIGSFILIVISIIELFKGL